VQTPDPTTPLVVDEPVGEDGPDKSTYPTSDTVLTSANIHLSHEVMGKRKLNMPFSGVETLALPEVSLDQELDIWDKNPDTQMNTTPKGEIWSKIAAGADPMRPLAAQYEDTLTREGSEFHQHLITERGPMSLSVPSFSTDTEKLSPEQALLKIRAVMGQGSLVSIPLFHSGFWITIKAPANGDIVELRRQLVEERVRLGRSTHGMILSNTTAYANRYLLDIAMDHLYTTTLKDGDAANVRSLIKAPDLAMIHWGLACAVYPSGFEYVKAVMSAEGIKEGTHETGVIDVKKLMWVDNGSLTEPQRRHMASRQPRQMTRDMVEQYQKSMRLAEGRTFDVKTLDDQNAGLIKITLGIPTVTQYVDSGEQWVQGLIDIIERSLTGDRTDENRRNEAIFDHARVTRLRQNAHWIASVDVGGKTFDDRDFISQFLNDMSENDVASEDIMREVRRYIDDCTVALIAIPSSNGDKVGPDRFPRLIPIDPLSAFFTLFMQRANRLTQTN
jgi:hypothetical protein